MQRSIPLWSLILVSVASMLVGSGLSTYYHSRTNPSAALAAVNTYLNDGEIQNAYDALLAAMRVAPEDFSVFDASLVFARKVGKDANDEDMLLAQDIHQRTASLIPYLPLTRIKAARASHSQVGDELFGSKKFTTAEDPLAEVENLLEASRRVDLPNFARTRLLHEAEAELGNQARRAASRTMKPNDSESFWNRWKSVKDQYEEAQKVVLVAVYEEECKPKVQLWTKKVEELNTLRAKTNLNEIHRANEEILALIVEGQRISRDLTPYLEGGVEAALKDSQVAGPDKHLNRLAQLREWNYNRWALDRVDNVDHNSSGSALDMLKSLAIIEESRLAPFVAQRFSEVWKKFFESCSKEDKVEATKLRIIREFQP